MEEIIKLENLSYAYPDGQNALTDISLTVCRGDSLGIIGPNGAGKSTLLLHLNGILRSDGKVRVFSEPVTGKNLKDIRRRIGLVFQNPDDQLFSATVFDDVAFGPLNLDYSEAEVRQAVTDALAEVGMSGFERRSPHHLSLGERKRIAIATILSMRPEVLALDEPTSNLDPCGKWQLLELLRAMPVTKIIATHDLEVVSELCSRVVILDKGKIVADGPAAEILNDKALLSAHGLSRPAATKSASASGYPSPG
jgi:cobalt/nickel transport system ATP-binding protein